MLTARGMKWCIGPFPISSNALYFILLLFYSLSGVRLFANPWTLAHQAPLSMGFFRKEYQIGLPFPSPGDLPNPGIKPTSPALASGFFTTEVPGKPCESVYPALVAQVIKNLPAMQETWV